MGVKDIKITRKHMRALEKVKEFFGTQDAIAESLGVSPQSVNDWFKKRRPIPLEKALRLSLMLQDRITAHDLRPDLFSKQKPLTRKRD